MERGVKGKWVKKQKNKKGRIGEKAESEKEESMEKTDKKKRNIGIRGKKENARIVNTEKSGKLQEKMLSLQAPSVTLLQVRNFPRENKKAECELKSSEKLLYRELNLGTSHS